MSLSKINQNNRAQLLSKDRFRGLCLITLRVGRGIYLIHVRTSELITPIFKFSTKEVGNQEIWIFYSLATACHRCHRRLAVGGGLLRFGRPSRRVLRRLPQSLPGGDEAQEADRGQGGQGHRGGGQGSVPGELRVRHDERLQRDGRRLRRFGAEQDRVGE